MLFHNETCRLRFACSIHQMLVSNEVDPVDSFRHDFHILLGGWIVLNIYLDYREIREFRNIILVQPQINPSSHPQFTEFHPPNL